jgi:hypothetical protein
MPGHPAAHLDPVDELGVGAVGDLQSGPAGV